MSYCRDNGEDSEVYVIGTDNALECCGCRLYKHSFQSRRYSAMIRHLEYHRKMGDKVPIRAFTRLKEEQKAAKDLFMTTNNRPFNKNARKSKNELLEQKFWKEMEYHRKKKMTQTTLEVFKDVYGRKPHGLELEGLAEAASIKMDLQFSRIFEN